MPLYTVTKTRTALNTSNDSITIAASSTKPLRVYMIDSKGADSSSTPNEIVCARSSGGTTGGGGITPSPINRNSSAASFSAYTTWTAQPTLGAVLWRLAPNANGGKDTFVAIPGAEIQIPVSGQMSLRSASGVSNVVLNLLIEEVDG